MKFLNFFKRKKIYVGDLVYFEGYDPHPQKNILELILDKMPPAGYSRYIEESTETFLSGIVIEIQYCEETNRDMALVLTNTNKHSWYDTLRLKLVDE